jgi:hypothetical protein
MSALPLHERRSRIPTDGQALDEIQLALDGRQWDEETIETVASLLRATGRPVRDLTDEPIPPSRSRAIAPGLGRLDGRSALRPRGEP